MKRSFVAVVPYLAHPKSGGKVDLETARQKLHTAQILLDDAGDFGAGDARDLRRICAKWVTDLASVLFLDKGIKGEETVLVQCASLWRCLVLVLKRDADVLGDATMVAMASGAINLLSMASRDDEKLELGAEVLRTAFMDGSAPLRSLSVEHACQILHQIWTTIPKEKWGPLSLKIPITNISRQLAAHLDDSPPGKRTYNVLCSKLLCVLVNLGDLAAEEHASHKNKLELAMIVARAAFFQPDLIDGYDSFLLLSERMAEHSPHEGNERRQSRKRKREQTGSKKSAMSKLPFQSAFFRALHDIISTHSQVGDPRVNCVSLHKLVALIFEAYRTALEQKRDRLLADLDQNGVGESHGSSKSELGGARMEKATRQRFRCYRIYRESVLRMASCLVLEVLTPLRERVEHEYEESTCESFSTRRKGVAHRSSEQTGSEVLHGVFGEDDFAQTLFSIVSAIATHSVYQPSEDFSRGQEKALRRGVGKALRFLTSADFRISLQRIRVHASDEMKFHKVLQNTSAFIRTCLHIQHRLFQERGDLSENDKDRSSLWVQTLFFCEEEHAYLSFLEQRRVGPGLLENVFDIFLQLRNVSQMVQEMSKFLIERSGHISSDPTMKVNLFDKDGAGFDLFAEFVARVPIAETQAIVDTLCILTKENAGSSKSVMLGDLFRAVCMYLPISADNANNVATALVHELRFFESIDIHEGSHEGHVELFVWLHGLHQRCMYFYECIHPDSRELAVRRFLLNALAEQQSKVPSGGTSEETLKVFALEIFDSLHGKIETLSDEFVEEYDNEREEIDRLLTFIFKGMGTTSAKVPLQAWKQIFEHIVSLQSYLLKSQENCICDFLVRGSLGDEGLEAQRYVYSLLEDAALYEISFLGEKLIEAFVRSISTCMGAATAKHEFKGSKKQRKMRPKSQKRGRSRKAVVEDSQDMLRALCTPPSAGTTEREIFLLTEDYIRSRVEKAHDKNSHEENGSFLHVAALSRAALVIGLVSALPENCFHRTRSLLILMYIYSVCIVEATHVIGVTVEEMEEGRREALRILLDQLFAGSRRMLSIYAGRVASGEQAEHDVFKHYMYVSEFALEALKKASKAPNTKLIYEVDPLISLMEQLWSFAFVEHARRALSLGDLNVKQITPPRLVLQDCSMVKKGVFSLVSNCSFGKSTEKSQGLIQAVTNLVSPSTGLVKEEIGGSETVLNLVFALCEVWWQGTLSETFGEEDSFKAKLKAWFFALPTMIIAETDSLSVVFSKKKQKVEELVKNLHDIAWVLITTWQRFRMWLGLGIGDLRSVPVSEDDPPRVEPSENVMRVHRCMSCVFLLLVQFQLKHNFIDERKDLGLLLATLADSLSDQEFVSLARLTLRSAQTGRLPLQLQEEQEGVFAPAAKFILVSLIMGARSQLQVTVCKRAASSVALVLADGIDEALQRFSDIQATSDSRIAIVELAKGVWDCVRFLIVKRDRWFLTLGELHRLLSGSAQFLALVLEWMTNALGKVKFVLLRDSEVESTEAQGSLECFETLGSCVHCCASMVLALLLTNPLLAARSPVSLVLLLRDIQRTLAVSPAIAVVMTSTTYTAVVWTRETKECKKDCNSISKPYSVFLERMRAAHAVHLKSCRIYARLLEAISGPRFDGKLRRFLPSLIVAYAKHASIPSPPIPRELRESSAADIRWVAGGVSTPGLGNEIRDEIEQGIHWMIASLSKHERIHIVHSSHGVDLAMIKRIFKEFEYRSKYTGAK